MPNLTTRLAAALVAASMLWTVTLAAPATARLASAQPALITALA